MNAKEDSLSDYDLQIKQRDLDKNLPQNSDLRKYLATKDETAKSPWQRFVAKPFQYRVSCGNYPRTLLVMPPMCLYEGSVKRVIPPLGLCYIAAYLENQGIEVDILDCIVEGLNCEESVGNGIWKFGMSEEAFRCFIREHDYEVVGFSMIYSSDLNNLYRYAELVKKEKPETIVFAGGLHASIYTEIFLKGALRHGRSVVDFVIRGEGEKRVAYFLENLKEGIIDLHADGFAGWVDGKLFVNPQLEVIQNLDELPFPAYHKVPLARYFEHNVPFSPYPKGKRVMQILTSRGCPVGCTFCASTNFNKSYRTRSADNVISEIKFYKSKYDIDEIQFADDNLTFNYKRSLEFFERLRDCNLPWCTPNGIMVNTLTKDLLDLMIDSGLYQITLSIDSGNAETLKNRHRKPVNLNQIPNLMSYLEDKQILMHGTLVVGMPGETEEDIVQGFKYVEKLPFHSINVFIAQAIPGSELFEKAVLDGIITYENALHIDTAKSTLELSDIEGTRLEELVESFLDRYNKKIYARDPLNWHKKYVEHRERMARICIGKPSAITSKIIEADQRGDTVQKYQVS